MKNSCVSRSNAEDPAAKAFIRSKSALLQPDLGSDRCASLMTRASGSVQGMAELVLASVLGVDRAEG